MNTKCTCARCGIGIIEGYGEGCWYCGDDLCSVCWDVLGHCGHPEADTANKRALTFKPGDPVLPMPEGNPLR